MKQRLLASALFCASLAVAPVAGLAEIALTGQAAMGLGFEQGKPQAVSDMQLTLQAARITDGGVEFGAVVDLNQPQSRGFRDRPPRAALYMSIGDFSSSAKK